MENCCDRRAVLTLGARSFLLLKTVLPLFASDQKMTWRSFLDRVRQFTDLASRAQTQETYVKRVERLLDQLDYGDPDLRARACSSLIHEAFPRFHAVEKSVAIEVQLLSFDPGASIEAHDHPQMTGVMACLSGQVAIGTYEPLTIDSARRAATLRRCGAATLLPGKTSTLTATRGNIHQLVAPNGCELIDIFTPPYTPYRTHATRWYELANDPIDSTRGIFPASIRSI